MRCGSAGPHRIFELWQAGDLLAAGLAGEVVDGGGFGEGEAVLGGRLASTVLHPMKRNAQMEAV